LNEAKRYRTILADPPWPYRQKLDRPTTRGGLKYPTMSVEEIAAIPVSEWADRDCQCWLWATNAHLHDAFHVLEAWGFRYITMATWVKTKMGLGYWLRGKTEHLLLGVSGSPRSKFIGEHGESGYDWSTFMHAPPRGHSKKPNCSYDMIEALSEEPRLELFARLYRLGWETWGDELGIKIPTIGPPQTGEETN